MEIPEPEDAKKAEMDRAKKSEDEANKSETGDAKKSEDDVKKSEADNAGNLYRNLYRNCPNIVV